MDTQGLLLLVQVVLPTDILTKFAIVKVESNDNEIRIYLDEIADNEFLENIHIKSKGFTDPVTIRDFSMRAKGVDLIVRRRRWYNNQTNKSFSVPIEGIKADGTRYSKELAAFFKKCMETKPTPPPRSLENYYHINGDTLEKQYKEQLSGHREWPELSHADEWLVFPQNIGESICIDETSISDGELYTIITNRASRGKSGSIISIIQRVRSEDIIQTLRLIPLKQREQVKEITMDFSNSMSLVARRCFPKAIRTIDRSICRSLLVMHCKRCV